MAKLKTKEDVIQYLSGNIDPRLERLFNIPQHEQRSDEWYKLREQRLTASDVATAIGMNPYSSRADLVYKKSGGPNTFKGNEATKYGQKWEDHAISRYEEKTGKKVIDFGLISHPTIDMLGGSPDGVCTDCTVIEVKCPLKREIIPGEIPGYYFPQVQVVMECLNMEETDFIQYKPPGDGPEILEILNIKRDREWFSRYFPVMRLFWDEVTHYRNIGLEYNPLHIKKEMDKKKKEEKKTKKLEPDFNKFMFSKS
tara:strand:- start:6864 stop:7625 length:762 start_codon:yes stop_codon:yes gene_type:complete